MKALQYSAVDNSKLKKRLISSPKNSGTQRHTEITMAEIIFSLLIFYGFMKGKTHFATYIASWN